MQRRFFVSALFTGFILLLLIAGNAHANRWASLKENQLIGDEEDVFLYPQILFEHRNALSFDYGAGEDAGRVLYLGGWPKLGLGLSAYYGSISPAFNGPIPLDLLNQESEELDLENTGLDYAPFSLDSLGRAEPFMILDGYLAIPTAIGPFGARIGIGNRSQYSTTDDRETGSGETLLTVEGGLSGKTPMRWDSSMSLFFDFYGEKNAATDSEGSDMLVRASLSGRSYLPLEGRLELGLLGNIGFANVSSKDHANGDETKANGMGLGVMAGAGPVYRVTEKTIIAGYGLLGVTTASHNGPIVDDTISTLIIQVPALRVAADLGITDWFFFRSGIQYSFQITNSYREVNARPPNSTSETGGKFGWSAGVGFEYSGFTVDGTLSQDFLTSGPDFIGGNPDALFGVVTARYHW